MKTEYQIILTAVFDNETDQQAWVDKIKQAMPNLKTVLPTPSAGPSITKRSYLKADDLTEAI